MRCEANSFVVVNVDFLGIDGGRDQKSQQENKREFESHLVSPKPGDLRETCSSWPENPFQPLTSHIELSSIAMILVAMPDPHRTTHS